MRHTDCRLVMTENDLSHLHAKAVNTNPSPPKQIIYLFIWNKKAVPPERQKLSQHAANHVLLLINICLGCLTFPLVLHSFTTVFVYICEQRYLGIAFENKAGLLVTTVTDAPLRVCATLAKAVKTLKAIMAERDRQREERNQRVE